MSPATQIVHWPGKDTPMCDKHAAQAKGLAAAMGFSLSCTLILVALVQDGKPLEPLTCKNCENEAKHHADRPTELP